MGSGIPVGYSQASEWSSVPAGLSLGPLLRIPFGFPVFAQDIEGGQAIPMVVRTRAGLLRLAMMSLTHYTNCTKIANATINQQNASPFNGNTLHATISLQTMIGVRSKHATHNPRWRRRRRRAEANHRRAAPHISGQRPSAWQMSRKTSDWPLGGGHWRSGYSGPHHCTLGWGIWQVGRIKVGGRC